MAGSVLSGYVMAALRADQLWQQLSPQPGLAAGDVQEAIQLPFVLVRDRVEESEWVAPPLRFATHVVEVDVWAQGATQAGAENPAEVIAGHVERVLNDPALEFAGISLQVFLETKHSLTEEKQRAGDKGRVYKAAMEWRGRFYRAG